MAAVQDVYDKLTQTAVEKKKNSEFTVYQTKSTFLLSGLGQGIGASLGTHVPRRRCSACTAAHPSPATPHNNGDGAHLCF